MKRIITISGLFLFFLFMSFISNAQSTSWTGSFNTYWNNILNWSNGIPDATKDVVIGDASFTGLHQPKVNVVGTCKSISIGGTRAAILTLTRTLNVMGNFTINPTGSVLHPASTAYLAGNFTNNGFYNTSATGSRFILNGTNQTISGSTLTIFRRLTINAGCSLHLATNIRLDSAGSLLAVYGVVDPGQSPSYTLQSTGLSRVYTGGKLLVYAPTFTANYLFTGTNTLYGGSAVEYASTTADQQIQPTLSYSTLILSGTGRKYLTANLLNLYGKDVTNGMIFVNSGITFDLQTFTANRAATKVGGQFVLAPGAQMKLSGLNNFPLNYATRNLDVTSTVEYNGVDQTVSPQVYGNLLLATPGIKTATLPFQAMGNFTVNGATLNTNAVIVNHSVAGNFIMNTGAFTGTAYTYSLHGSSDQQVSLSQPIARLNINKASGRALLAADLTINTSLNFTKGVIETGNNRVIIPIGATVTGAGQSTGWVYGQLQKNIVAGSSIVRNFEVGDNNYSPVTLLFTSVSTAGIVTAASNGTDQPEIDYSGLDPAKTVNRYWTLNNGGVVFSNATAIFQWTASDVDGGSATADFKAGRFNGATWSLAATSTAMPTSIQANSLTTLGDFSVGEIIGRSTWTGNAMTSDWFTPKNWLGLIPTSAKPTIIPNNLLPGRVYPVISGITAQVGDLEVEPSASVTVSGGTLQVAGVLTSASNISAAAGTIEFNGSAFQTIPPAAFAANTVQNLVISNNVGLDDNTIVTGLLTIGNGKTFSTNDNLVLRSNATGTAAIAPLPVDGSGNATAFITGEVSIERYIPARKAWRLLTTPIKSSSMTSLADSWQEGAYTSSFAPNPNPHPGYGVHIAGGTVTNGFDQSPTNSATVKIFDSNINNFTPLPSTPGTFVPAKTYPGYFVYIRGNRGIDLSQGNAAAITSTTLRVKGEINTGKQVATVHPTNFTVLGNPFPAAIDFGTIGKSNVRNSFYIWDPKLAGSNGLGAYVTVSWNAATSSYDITSSASPISQYIPSGEAVLVESLDGVNPGTITINESDKTTNGSDLLFGRPSTVATSLRTNLLARNADGTKWLLDGALTTYSTFNNNSLDRDDIKKLAGGSENISLVREGVSLAIERKALVTTADTSFLKITGMRIGKYTIEIIAENLLVSGYTAVLKDRFNSTLNNTVLNQDGTTSIDFEVTSAPASYAPDRFSVVFVKDIQPFEFTSVEFNRNGPTIEIAGTAAVGRIHPNPATQNLVNVQMGDLQNGKYQLGIYNMQGQQLKTVSIQHNGGLFNYILRLDGLSAGRYEIQLKGNSTNQSFPLIKN